MGIMNAYGEMTPKRLKMGRIGSANVAQKLKKSSASGGMSGTRFAYSDNFTENQLYMNVIKET